MTRLLGLDPGLRNTGWGIIESEGNRLKYVADGTVHSTADLSLAERLTELYMGISDIIEDYSPHEAAVEETFVNKNPVSTLKLGQARGVILLAPSIAGLPVAEYSANKIKKSVTGAGHANKNQINMMVQTLLGGCKPSSKDSADALAVAICHAHLRNSVMVG
ncbi:MAG: crossover junction endodeoxyribonuclease RuvC [Alphaproteobacteria bacterium]|nr:crossover junction endodeoxyribonuclease RuvC [Alphaproteobacteria bacterium]